MRRKYTITRKARRPAPSSWRERFQDWIRFEHLHPVMVPVVTFCVLLVITLAGYAFFTRDKVRATDSLIVIINHDKVERTVTTRPTTVGDLLDKLDIPVREGDVVEPAQVTPIAQDDFRINVYRAKPVQIVDEGRRVVTFSAAQSARTIAKQAGATVFPEDKLVTQPVTDFLADGTLGQKVVIDRAKPVSINLYGNPVSLRTHADTVSDLLEEKNIKLGPDDQVQPGLDAAISPETQVFLLRRGIQIATVTEDIAMETETLHDDKLAFGTSAVRQQGAPGKRIVTYQIDLQNGKEIARKQIQAVISQQSVKHVVVQGTSLSGLKGNMALAGIAPGDYQYVDHILSKESGWCPTKWQGEYGGCPAYHGTPTSAGTGYGLCQSTPGWKMASAGADWGTNPVTQLKWCHGYATGKYGSWRAAYNFWVTNHWW